MAWHVLLFTFIAPCASNFKRDRTSCIGNVMESNRFFSWLILGLILFVLFFDSYQTCENQFFFYWYELLSLLALLSLLRWTLFENVHLIAFMQVLDIVSANPEDSGPLNLNIVGRRDLSSSWVQEEITLVSRNQVPFCVRQNVVLFIFFYFSI